MAVRFDADGEDYTRALALGTQAALTVTCWLKVSVNRATWSTPWSIDNGTGDNWLIQTGTDGVTLGTVFDATSQQNMGALTVGTWYFVALAMNGSNGFLYHKTAATGLSTVTVDGGTASVNAATLRIGESPWGGEWWNGCIAAMKVWTAQLSAAEVANEAAQYQPRRVANLVAYYPLVRPETTDYSGNARTLTGGTGTTREDGPPIPWRPTSPRITLPTTAVGGPITIGQAIETDTGTVLARTKTRTVGLASEVDTAAAVARSKTRGIATATETDTAAAVARSKTRPVSQASETSTATLLARSKTLAVGVSVETNTAHPVAVQGQNVVAIGQAAETGTATQITRTKLLHLLPAAETDNAHSVTRAKRLLLTLATETDTAHAVIVSDLEFVCQDLSGVAAPISYSGAAAPVVNGGPQPTVIAYGGSTTQVSYGGTATICGR